MPRKTIACETTDVLLARPPKLGLASLPSKNNQKMGAAAIALRRTCSFERNCDPQLQGLRSMRAASNAVQGAEGGRRPERWRRRGLPSRRSRAKSCALSPWRGPQSSSGEVGACLSHRFAPALCWRIQHCNPQSPYLIKMVAAIPAQTGRRSPTSMRLSMVAAQVNSSAECSRLRRGIAWSRSTGWPEVT